MSSFKGAYDYFKPGDFNALCDRCGEKLKASMLRLEWDGFMVCDRCFEYRQPQDFVRGVRDQQAPPWTRPEPADTFVSNICTLSGRQSFVNLGIANCMIVNLSLIEQ